MRDTKMNKRSDSLKQIIYFQYVPNNWASYLHRDRLRRSRAALGMMCWTVKHVFSTALALT